jgi:uncharacterized membrane protein YedE/YeeE
MNNELLIAIGIGFGMGFFLERAGFGSARKLVSQFYLHDMAVFKVMFTAIVVAMTGIYLCTIAGAVNFEDLPLTGTFLLPQLVGGLILGVGFIIGGYCPGTSGVAAATGKIDGIVYMAGMLAGMACFAMAYPTVEEFYTATALGQQTIFGYFGIPYGLVVGAVILMAIGGFVGATQVEKKFSWLKPEE